ncbi:MAG: triple tyrosine motif-containing protein [Bacteroidota bacterium]
MKQATLFLFFLMLTFVWESEAQQGIIGSPNITNFSRTDYQAGTQNWMLQQGKNGLIYFANNKGVLEFDGTNWHTYPLPNSSIARSIAIDQDGKIYVGGQDEFGYIQPNERGQNTYYSLTPLIPPTHQSFDDIWKIFIRNDGVYFCSERAIFRLKDNTIKVITPPNDRFENFFEWENQILVQSLAEGLFKLQTDQLVALPFNDDIPKDRIVGILPYQPNQAVLFTFSEGPFLMDDSGIKTWDIPARAFLLQHQTYCAIALKNGQYAIGTPQFGLLLVDNAGRSKAHLNKSMGLQNNTILSIGQDVQENLWLGLDNGIDYAEINSPFSKIRAEEGVAGTGYASIISDGKLYMGTNQGLYYTDWVEKNDPTDLRKFTLVENGLGQVWSINQLAEQIIVGQHKGAAYLEAEKMNAFSDIQGAWKFLELRSKPDYAVEGTYSGLYLYQKRKTDQGKTRWNALGKIKGFDESSRIFEEDQDGNIWVSHAYKGLYKLTPDASFSAFDKVQLYNSQNGLPTNLLLNVVTIRNELVVTTPKGVFKFDKKKDQFVPHQDFIEIFGAGRVYHRLIEDELGDIWFSIDNEFGILKVKEQGVFNQLKVYYFNQIQEDLVDGFEHIYTYDKNNIFIGTEKGFIHYSPPKDKKASTTFRTLIRKVTSITEGDSIIYWGNQLENENSKGDFHNQMNDFRFAFSSPYFEKITYMTYRFQLEGFDDTWSEWSAKTEKEYTNLPAGNYTFRVQAKNAYGQKSETATYDFSIRPPWYGSWYAKLAYFIIGLFGFYALTKLISKQEKKKTEAFKVEQDQKFQRKENEFKKEVAKSENEIIKLKNERLNENIKHKNSQLASATMHLVQKSEILMKIKSDLKNVESEAPHQLKRKIQQITRTIESDIQLDENWEQFVNYFDQVHENFFKRLRKKFPNLTPKDQKLCAYLRMNLTTKEIAPLLNISVRGVEISRYRLRKKLDLNSEVNLVAFIMEV